MKLLGSQLQLTIEALPFCWDHEISINSDPRNSVSMKTRFKLFINHGNHDDSFAEVIIHIYGFFCYDLLCDLSEMLNLINIGSAVATRRNLVDPIQRTKA
jgi:hypothetical protein